MKIKAVVLLLFCSIATGILAIFYNMLTRSQTKIISPLADRSAKVLAEKIVLTPTPTPSPRSTIKPSPTPTVEPTPTITPTPTPIIIAPADLDQLFVKYSSEYSINKDILVKIAKCESNFNPNAVYLNYAGLYQFTETLWTQTRSLMGQNTDTNLRFNAEESVRTAAFMISQGHLGIWPNCNK